MPNRKIIFALLLVVLSTSVSCSRKGMAVGGCSVYYSDPAEAQKIAIGIATVVSHGGNRIEITPRHRLGDNGQVISYTIDVHFNENWDLKEDDDLRTLLLKHITPRPDEIYSVNFPGLKHSQRNFDRQESIKEFWEFLWSRPHAGYSIEEVRQLLPVENIKILDVDVASSQTFIFDWPHDERSLTLSFTYDEDKGAALLQSYGLGYPNETKTKQAASSNR